MAPLQVLRDSGGAWTFILAWFFAAVIPAHFSSSVEIARQLPDQVQ